MCKAHFEIETSCSHPEWYRYPLEYIFTPYAEPGKARETVRRTHPDLDRQMRFAADGPREWKSEWRIYDNSARICPKRTNILKALVLYLLL